MIKTELRYNAVNRTMKAITPSEHKRNIEYFNRFLLEMKDSPVSETITKNMGELDSFYDDYLYHISELRILLDKYHTQTADLRDFCKNQKKIADNRSIKMAL